MFKTAELTFTWNVHCFDLKHQNNRCNKFRLTDYSQVHTFVLNYKGTIHPVNNGVLTAPLGYGSSVDDTSNTDFLKTTGCSSGHLKIMCMTFWYVVHRKMWTKTKVTVYIYKFKIENCWIDCFRVHIKER